MLGGSEGLLRVPWQGESRRSGLSEPRSKPPRQATARKVLRRIAAVTGPGAAMERALRATPAHCHSARIDALEFLSGVKW